jgi:hypothetical protein
MKEKDLVEYKRRYHLFRHHAWAGLGFLSVVLALRLIFYEEAQLLNPIIIILAIYIIVALVFTYRYRSGLNYEGSIKKVEAPESLKRDIEKDKLDAELEKKRWKLEKKKEKAEIKKIKKEK